MSYFTKDFFSFKGYVVKKVSKDDKEIMICLSSRRKTAICTTCGKRSRNLYEKGFLRKIRHSRYEGKAVSVLVPKRRFFCLDCDAPFNEKIDWVSFKARSTHNFTQETVSGLKNNSFTAIQEMYSTSYQFLSKNLRGIDTSIPWPKGELILGFDEHSYAKGHMMVTVTELKTKTLLAVLSHYNKSSVEKYLKERSKEERERVKELCFDMKFKQRRVVESFFPEAATVVDKFHVISYLSLLIDGDRRDIAHSIGGYERIRQIMRKQERMLNKKESMFLRSVFKKYPEIKKLWLIYQKLHKMYRSKDKDKARIILDEISNDLSNLNKYHTREFKGTINRMREEILNYFDNRTTNAFTEGVHTKIKMIKRTSFGFRNIEVYIKKVMLAFIPFAIILEQLLPH